MRRFVPSFLAVVLALGVRPVVAQAPRHQVLAPSAALDDGRVKAPWHLDAPAPFTPAFATQAEWEARAAVLRKQVQVAVGLWPMPERGPVRASIHGRIVGPVAGNGLLEHAGDGAAYGFASLLLFATATLAWPLRRGSSEVQGFKGSGDVGPR